MHTVVQALETSKKGDFRSEPHTLCIRKQPQVVNIRLSALANDACGLHVHTLLTYEQVPHARTWSAASFVDELELVHFCRGQSFDSGQLRHALLKPPLVVVEERP